MLFTKTTFFRRRQRWLARNRVLGLYGMAVAPQPTRTNNPEEWQSTEHLGLDCQHLRAYSFERFDQYVSSYLAVSDIAMHRKGFSNLWTYMGQCHVPLGMTTTVGTENI